MKKTSKGSSFLSSVVGIFTDSSTQKAMKKAQQMRTRIQAGQHRRSPSEAEHPYRAAEIVADDCACDAVKPLTGTRFLMDEVPHIPVRGCTSRKCNCAYVRHLDRRNTIDIRRAQYAALTNAYTTSGNTERRASFGRRADDAPLTQLL